jgi:hypothetical protein
MLDWSAAPLTALEPERAAAPGTAALVVEVAAAVQDERALVRVEGAHH